MRFYLYFLFLITPLLAEVIHSPTIETLIEKSAKPFWLVVDIDNTLFEGKEAYGHCHWFDDLYAQEMARGSTKEEAIGKLDGPWIESQKINTVQPVEDKFIAWIDQLQKENITVLGLTARQPKLSSSTYRQLELIGVDLSKTAPKGTLKNTFNQEVKYENGILFINDFNEKGPILLAFLEENGYQPETILFVDDKLHNVQSVEKVLEAKGISVIGLYYKALLEREPVYNPTIAKFQQEKLHKLLSNDEALLLLHHQPDIHQ